MLRKFITPENANINLSIPQDYVGKRLEVLLYAVDEINDNVPLTPITKRKPSEFAGCISKESALAMLQQSDFLFF